MNEIMQIVLEAMMKRSNPYVSGEKEGNWQDHINPPPPPPRNKVVLSLASKANVSYEVALAEWVKAKEGLDKKTSNYYAIVTTRTKKALGIK